ncbi:arrestin domain-containing protein 3-like [Periophthalmus magnuspinnatus]|uniref:arrestin domain-containing protein 3-like n=1 Tax=Periophthalmus magnuspinnatus TaxID=409849 RepID=UPI0024372690|nr:arrestin domain-containing protein 3-like [Periophthalmus magnuspinnatus]
MTIHNFSIEYDAINSNNLFTNGDTINGRIILEVSKEIKIQALVFIAQGEARVCWHEQYGQYVTMVYTSKDKYYSVEHNILRETRHDDADIGPGRHVFPFSFKIPDRKMPSTFKSSVGKIVHKLKAELKQSMKITKTAKTHFTFVSQADMDIPGLLEPQYGCKDKTISAFGSGTVAIDVSTERLGYWQGEVLQVTAEIKNQSSRMVKPKLVLYKKKSYFAEGKRRMNTSDILKEKCDPVESGSNKTVTKSITIPKELPPSILNCSIIKLEYRLKILLDITCSSNPEIKLPIVVLPEQNSHTDMNKHSAKLKGFEASAQPSPQNIYHPPVQALAQPIQSSAQPQPAAAADSDPPSYGSLYPSYPHTDQNWSQF